MAGETVTFSSTLDDMVRYSVEDSAFKLFEEIRRQKAEGRQVYNLTVGQSPFPVPEHMVEALQEYAGEAAYLAVEGIPELREAICKFHANYDGLTDLDPDNVIVASGSKMVLYLIMLIFKGDILLLSPSWITYEPQCILTNHKAIKIEASMEDEWCLTPERLEKAINENDLARNRLLIFCNPSNPTGATYTADQLKALSEVFRKHRIVVVSDEIYAMLHYNHQHESLFKYYPEGTIISSGFSKWAAAAGWRVGYSIFPPSLKPLRDAVFDAGSHIYSLCPAPMQYAVAKGLGYEDLCRSFILHTTRILKIIADFCHSQLTAVGVQAMKAKAAFYMILDFAAIQEALHNRGITTSLDMCAAIFKETGVGIVAAGPAYLRPPEELTARLCFVNFNGAVALAASRDIGLDNDLAEDFVPKYCTPMYDATMRLKEWVNKQQE